MNLIVNKNTVALATINTSPVGTGSTAGVIFRATLKDSAGLATGLGSLDAVQFTSSAASDVFTSCSDATCTGAMTNGVATQGMFLNGVGYFKVKSASATSTISTITATGSGTLAASVTGTTSATFKAMSALTTTLAGNTLTQGLGSTVAGYSGVPSQSAAWTMKVKSTATSSAVKFTFPTSTTIPAAAGFFYVTITDTNKKIIGADTLANLQYQQTCSYAALATSCSVTTTHGALGTTNSYSVTTVDATTAITGIGATAAVITVQGDLAATSGTNVLAATPAGPVAAVAKGTITINANLTDQFAGVIANATVNVAVSGRNTVASTPKITDADGNISFTYTDAGTISARCSNIPRAAIFADSTSG
jgi:hypothetical protein